jgi:hypothetical protein
LWSHWLTHPAKPIPVNTPPQTETVKLTYKLPFETNTEPAKLEDEVKVKMPRVDLRDINNLMSDDSHDVTIEPKLTGLEQKEKSIVWI